ncbi:MAG: DUF1398 family protein [Ferruginibacter sp.]
MFTISQIKEAHSKVKSGSDFPNYIQDLIKLGLTKYDTYVSDGHGEYFGTDNYEIKSEAKYPMLIVAEESDTEKFKRYLKIHQQGQTDYMTFCNHSAECGIEKWTVNTVEMTCIYFDKQGTKILTETIPG